MIVSPLIFLYLFLKGIIGVNYSTARLLAMLTPIRSIVG